MIRRFPVFLSATVSLCIGIALVSPAAPAEAVADYSCGSPFCYSVGAEVQTFSGLEGQWDDRVISMPASEADDFGHLNNEMWAIMSNGQWVEEGLSYQCTVGPQTSGNCTDDGGTEAYLQFWGDSDSSGDIFFHLIGTLSPDGDNHVYEIFDSSDCTDNEWQVYLDYNLVGTSTDQSTCRADRLNAGLELDSPTGINSNEYTGGNWFENSMQYYENVNGAWDDASLDTDTWNSDACGKNYNCLEDPCSSYPDGQCLNGALEGSNVWGDNKPS